MTHPPFSPAHGQRSPLHSVSSVFSQFASAFLLTMAMNPPTQALEDLPPPVGNRKRVSAWLQSSPDVQCSETEEQLHPNATTVAEKEGEAGESDVSSDSQ